jgi:hypothetical protein
MFVKNSATNSTLVQKETIPNITLNFTMTLDVNFILTFLKARSDNSEKKKNLLIISLTYKLIYIETPYK